MFKRFAGFVNYIIEEYSADGYSIGIEKPCRRFPSVITALFRLLIKHWYITAPILWAGMLVGCIVAHLPFIGVIIVSVIATVLAALLIFVVFVLLMGLESIAKHISSLILYNELDEVPENPVDNVITEILNGKL